MSAAPRTACAMVAIVTVAALAACQKTEAEKVCDGLIAQLAACNAGPDPLPRSFERYCNLAMHDEWASGESLLTTARRALQDCGAQATCPALDTCLERHHCVWVMASPSAEPMFDCSR